MKKITKCFTVPALALCTAFVGYAGAPVIESIVAVPQLTIQSDPGVTNQIEFTTNLAEPNWVVLTNLIASASSFTFVDLSAPPNPKRFYRVVELPTNSAPAGMALIPAGTFTMGDSLDGDSDALPTHSVTVSAFYMDTNLVTLQLWTKVYQWATGHGYKFDNAGMGKALNHPVQTVNWYDTVKWCNARSEMEGLAPCYFTTSAETNVYRTGRVNLQVSFVNWTTNGYRLATEAEWEKAARGGHEGLRFPWNDFLNIINHSNANFYADPLDFPYDTDPEAGLDPRFNTGSEPFTSPVGTFAPNDYGLYDMAGNLFQWVWDSFSPYSNAAQTDPKGATLSANRLARGGTWCCEAAFSANGCRVAYRSGYGDPVASGDGLGFRVVRSANQ